MSSPWNAADSFRTGDRVVVAKVDRDIGYTEEAQARREKRVGDIGTVVEKSDGHGLCYRVDFQRVVDGHWYAYFDPDELAPAKDGAA